MIKIIKKKVNNTIWNYDYFIYVGSYLCLKFDDDDDSDNHIDNFVRFLDLAKISYEIIEK